MGITDELDRLKSENILLKWIIVQMMQRWAKDDFAMFAKVNRSQFALKLEDDDPRFVSVRVKRVEQTNEAADPDGKTGLN